MTIAVTHPGFLGDMLSAIPAARELARRHGCKAAFWTSKYCEPAADLLAVQEFVSEVKIDLSYTPTNGGCGLQPWRMGSAENPLRKYAAVYHLGFRETPTVPLPEYCCTLYGLPQLPSRFDLPEYHGRMPAEPFIVLAAKGDTTFRQTFRDFVKHCNALVVEVGIPGEAVATDLGTWNFTSPGFLEMAFILSRCRAFVGLLSAPLVLAGGWGCTKIGIHDGQSWDMRHVVRSGAHHYPVNPTGEELARMIG